MQEDVQFAWRVGQLYIPVMDFAGILSANGASASAGAGAAVQAAIGLAASELACVQMGAAGDEVYHFMPIPDDWDMDYNVYARIWFVHSATDADAPIWKLLYKFYAVQDALTDCGASGDDTITFAAHTVSTTDDSIEATVWTNLATAAAYASGDLFWAFCVECDDLGSASANEIELMGVEFKYTRGQLASGGKRQILVGVPTAL